MTIQTKPCPGCPDGSVWNSNGPTSKTCPICEGHAMVNMDGSALTKVEWDEIEDQSYADAQDEQSLEYFNRHIAGDR